MKKQYVTPEISILLLEPVDIITASPPTTVTPGTGEESDTGMKDTWE